jgi:hypothetical protein
MERKAPRGARVSSADLGWGPSGARSEQQKIGVKRVAFISQR